MKIVVIEDEPDIQTLLVHTLTQAGFTVQVAGSGESGLQLIAQWRPHVVILDVMLPKMTGFSVCRQLKANPDTRSIYVMMVSAKSDESDILVGLDVGADDYLTKPFSPKILVAKIGRISMKAAVAQGSGQISHGPFRIDVDTREAWISDMATTLTASEFSLLSLLVKNPGKILSRNQIIDEIKGEHYAVTDRTIDVLMVGLRRKLGHGAQWIETVRTVGYRMRR